MKSKYIAPKTSIGISGLAPSGGVVGCVVVEDIDVVVTDCVVVVTYCVVVVDGSVVVVP